MSTSTPTRRSTRNKQSNQTTLLSSTSTSTSTSITASTSTSRPSTIRQSRKRSIGKVEAADEFVDLSGSEDDAVESGMTGVGGMLTPPPSREREKKRRNVGTRTVLQGAPAPNPPFAPLPTPPQSRESEHATRFQNVLPLASGSERPSTPPPQSRSKPFLPGQTIPSTPPRLRTQFQSIAGSPGKRKVTDPSGKSKLEILPGHLKTLVLLHSAFDLSLGLWLATHPPILPPLEAELENAKRNGLDVDLVDLSNFLQIKGMVEKTCQRRFGITELRRLVWIWGWQGDEKALDDLEALQQETSKEVGGKTRAGDYLITLARTLDPITSRRTTTHGIGLTLHLTPLEVASLRNSLHTQIGANAGVSVGMGALGRWSAGGEERGKRFEAKVWRWWEVCKERSTRSKGAARRGEEDEDDDEDMVPNVPMAEIPKLPQVKMNLPSAAAGSSTAHSAGPSAVRTGSLLPAFEAPPAPRKPVAGSKTAGSTPGYGLFTPSRSGALASPLKPLVRDEEDVFGRVESIPSSSSSALGSSSGGKKDSVADRRQALYDRIKARTAKDQPTASSSSGDVSLHAKLGNMTKVDAAAELKRRSTLSRLEGVAEGVWMLFSSIPSNSGIDSSPGAPGSSSGGLGGINSSPLSKTRRRAFPMDQVVDIVVKSSKTPISAAEARDSLILLTTLCPSFLVLRLIARQEWLEMPAIQVTTTAIASAGYLAVPPASPGRPDVSVRDVTSGGRLREVRERIRRELGE